MKRLLCGLGIHRWEPTLFIGGDPTLYGDACERCDMVRIEGRNGWVYFDDDEGSEPALPADVENTKEGRVERNE